MTQQHISRLPSLISHKIFILFKLKEQQESLLNQLVEIQATQLGVEIIIVLCGLVYNAIIFALLDSIRV